MSNNDQKRMAEALSKLEGSNTEYTGSIPNNARTFIRRTITLQTAATNANGSNALAANASASQWRAVANGRLVKAWLIPSAAATEHASNNATVEAVKTQANGVGAGTAIATANTNTVANGGTGTLAPGAPVALTVTDLANARFTQGQVLSPRVSMNASGVALAAGTLELSIELEGPIDEGN
jgi:hypothetical protein